MNIAFTTLVLFFLILPGVFFRRFYYTEEFSKEYFKSSFFDVLTSAFIPAIIIQLVWISIIPLFGYGIDFELLGKLILSQESAIDGFRNIHVHYRGIAIYNISMWIIASFLGSFSKSIVRYFRIDRTRKFFRFQNEWHYILQGEIFDFPRSSISLADDYPEDIEVRYVDALVNTSDGAVLYEGILVDYNLSKTGSLDSIILTEVQRRLFKFDSIPTENELEVLRKKEPRVELIYKGHYDIPGHILVLPFKEVLNINLSYYTMDSEESGDGYNIRMVR
jgi:hypothetical protein